MLRERERDPQMASACLRGLKLLYETFFEEIGRFDDAVFLLVLMAEALDAEFHHRALEVHYDFSALVRCLLCKQQPSLSFSALLTPVVLV